MEKTIALILVLVMAFSLAACAVSSAEETITDMVEPSASQAETSDLNTTVSDSRWKDIQDLYAEMVTAYDQVSDYYQDGLEADETVDALLTEAQELIGQIGEISRESLTEGLAAELSQDMTAISEALHTIAQELGLD